MSYVSGLTYGAQYAIAQPSDRASYVVTFNAIPATPMDLAAIEAPAAPWASAIRLQRIAIYNPGMQTTPGLLTMQIMLTTTAGSGAVVTPAAIDPLDPVFAGICRSGNTTLGTGTPIAGDITLYVPGAVGAFSPMVLEMGGQGLTYKQPTARAGQGLTLRHPGAAGATNFYGYAVFTVDPS